VSAFVKATEWISRALASIAGVALVWMMVLLVGNIVLRLIAAPVHGTYEMVTMTSIFVLGLGLAEAQVAKSHVAINIVMARQSKKVQLVVGAIVTILAIIVFVQVVDALVAYGINQRASGSTTESLGIPYWPSVFALAVGFGALMLALVADLVRIRDSARSPYPGVDIW
jgi:TRAP-type C4-dicarboxylate transport system permease small subunit